jgi:carbamoyltransferase
MVILSVYPMPLVSYTHDASAAIISNGGVSYAYEEEKLSRFQYAISDFPEKASVLGMKSLGIRPQDVDLLVLTSINTCYQQAEYSHKVEYIKDLLSLRANVAVDCVPHHMAHSGLAVLTSPFDECVFLIMDGGGDNLMGHWGIYRNYRLEVIEQFELSPAILYGFITSLTGFSLFEEGKVMGLSSYGSLNMHFYDWLKQNFWIESGGASMRVADQIKVQWIATLDPQLVDADTFRRHKYLKLEVYFKDQEQMQWLSELQPLDIAHTGQRFFEDLITQAVQNIVRRTSIKNVALGGGAFQNIVLNGKLRAIPSLNIHVSMAPHDAGLSLGAGLIKWHERTERHHKYPLSAYLGPSFTNEEIEELLNSFSLSYERPTDLTHLVADYIAEGKVVGWFQGRAEFGARALGARSVLADPRNASAKARMNQALKKRDWFMPYAPSVLEEYGHEFFTSFSPSPYMNVGFQVKSDKIHLIPSAVHIDGSCRAHTIDNHQHPKYHQLIMEFYKLTGIPMVLNTSFNRHGVPIVATPRQALQHLLEGNVDVLAIEDFIVTRNHRMNRGESIYDEEYFLRWEQLLFASNLLRGGHLSRAQEIIQQNNIQIAVRPTGFESQGRLIWKMTQADHVLKTWWDDFWHRNKNAPKSD